MSIKNSSYVIFLFVSLSMLDFEKSIKRAFKLHRCLSESKLF